MPEQRLTASIYSFEKLIRGNFLYVDKTEYLRELIQPYSAMYFPARPRRFGKSLTLSALRAVFAGKRSGSSYDKPYIRKAEPVFSVYPCTALWNEWKTALKWAACRKNVCL